MSESDRVLRFLALNIPYEKHGEEFRFKCLFHNDDTPSCDWNCQEDVFYCFGCGVKGKLFNLEGKKGISTTMDKGKDRSTKKGFSSEIIFFIESNIDKANWSDSLLGRGFEKETFKTIDNMYVVKNNANKEINGKHYYLSKNQLVIKMHSGYHLLKDNDEGSLKSKLQFPNWSYCTLENAKYNPNIIFVTESFLAGLSIYQLGYNVHTFNTFDNYINWYEKISTIENKSWYIWIDNDDEHKRNKIIKFFQSKKDFTVFYYKNDIKGFDANDVLMKQGIEKLREIKDVVIGDMVSNDENIVISQFNSNSKKTLADLIACGDIRIYKTTKQDKYNTYVRRWIAAKEVVNDVIADDFIHDLSIEEHTLFKTFVGLHNSTLKNDLIEKGYDKIIHSNTQAQCSDIEKSVINKLKEAYDEYGFLRYVGDFYDPSKDTNTVYEIGGNDLINIYKKPYLLKKIDAQNLSKDDFPIFANYLRTLLGINDSEACKLREAELDLDWLLDFIANKINNPIDRMPVMIGFYSQQGTGKDIFAALLTVILGATNVFMMRKGSLDPNKSESRFNEKLGRCLIAVLNEMDRETFVDSYENYKLYSGTQGAVEVEAKHLGAKEVKIYLNLIFFTNNSDAFDLTKQPNDRRFVAFKPIKHDLSKNIEFAKDIHSIEHYLSAWSAYSENFDSRERFYKELISKKQESLHDFKVIEEDFLNFVSYLKSINKTQDMTNKLVMSNGSTRAVGVASEIQRELNNNELSHILQELTHSFDSLVKFYFDFNTKYGRLTALSTLLFRDGIHTANRLLQVNTPINFDDLCFNENIIEYFQSVAKGEDRHPKNGKNIQMKNYLGNNIAKIERTDGMYDKVSFFFSIEELEILSKTIAIYQGKRNFNFASYLDEFSRTSKGTISTDNSFFRLVPMKSRFYIRVNDKTIYSKHPSYFELQFYLKDVLDCLDYRVKNLIYGTQTKDYNEDGEI